MNNNPIQSKEVTEAIERLGEAAIAASLDTVRVNTTDLRTLLRAHESALTNPPVGEVPGEALFDALAHGDDEHRRWLKKAIEDHFAGRLGEADVEALADYLCPLMAKPPGGCGAKLRGERCPCEMAAAEIVRRAQASPPPSEPLGWRVPSREEVLALIIARDIQIAQRLAALPETLASGKRLKRGQGPAELATAILALFHAPLPPAPIPEG